MELAFSANHPDVDAMLGGDEDRIWTGPHTAKVPNESEAREVAARLDANVVVLMLYKKRPAGWHGQDFDLDVYVMDVDSGSTHIAHGDKLSFKTAIKSTMDRIRAL